MLLALGLAFLAIAAPRSEAAASYPNVVFSDGFESGALTNWNGTPGNGWVAAATSAARTGTNGLEMTNTLGQFSVLTKSLSAPVADSSVTFWIRPRAAAGVQTVAMARDQSSSGRMWELLYDGTNRRFYLFPYTATGSQEITTAAGTAPLDVWTQVEIRYEAASNGGARLYLNGQTQSSWGVTGNFARSSNFQTLQLWNDVTNTTYFDDVAVAAPAAGPVAPGAPTGPTAAGGNASAALNWTAPASNGGSPITGYRITPFANGAQQAPVLTGSTASNFNVTGLTNGTPYTFTVAAINAIGTGPDSTATSSVTPRAAASVPTAPSAVNGRSGDRSVGLDWTAPADDGGRTITGYRITPRVNGVAQSAITTSSAATTHTVTDLNNGTAYTFEIAAINSVGTGPASSPSSAITPGYAGPTDVMFADGFESGSLSAWNGTPGTGSVTVNTAAARNGTRGLEMRNTAGQYSVLVKNLANQIVDSSTRFQMRPTSAAGVQTVAMARDGGSSGRMWELLYDGTNRRLYLYAYTSTGNVEIVTSSNSAPVNTWLEIDIRYNATAFGNAQISINGQTQASWGASGNFSRADDYKTLQLWNDAANTTYFDDISVASAPPVPSAPLAPTAVNGVTDNASVALNWTAPSDNGGSAVTGYRITPYVGGAARTPVLTGSTATSFNMTGLTNDTGYTFTVAAINAIGTGPESAPTGTLTPRATATAPGAPTGLSGQVGNRSVALNWTAPTADGGRSITGYRITPRINNVAQTPVNTSSAATSHTVMGLTNGTAYTFTVAAVNSVGAGSASSATGSLTPSWSGPTDVVFTDGFESGSLSAWNGAPGTGAVTVNATAAQSGTRGLEMRNALGQYSILNKTFTTPLVDSSTRFWMRVATAAGLQSVAQARDQGSSGRMWELLYDATNRRFYLYAYTASASREIVTPINSAPIDTWMELEVRYNAATSGGAQLYINGQTQPSWGVTGNFARSTNFQTLQLWNDETNSTYFDGVHVAADPTAGVTVPNAPTAVRGSRGDGQVTLTWDAPSNNGGRAITSYRITPSVGSTQLPYIDTGNDSTTRTVTGLTNGTGYTFRVAATNSIGTSVGSDPSGTITPRQASAPDAPTNLTGTRGDGQVALNWNAPADDGGSAITGYRITPYIGTTAQSPVLTGATATAHTVTDLTNGTAYTFRVAAINALGTGADSAASASLSPRAPTVPDAPSNVAGTRGDAEVRLNWSAGADNGGSPITSYRITPYIGANAQTAVQTNSTTTSYTVTGLTNNTAYTFRVAAVNAIGTSANSSASAAVTPVPNPPNPIVVENQQPGTSSWMFSDNSKAENHEIEGYASLDSVDKGDPIDFKVSTSVNAQYTMSVYRMGSYPTGTNPDGSSCAPSCGGRLMQTIGPLTGYRQAACARETSSTSPDYGLTECNWDTSYSLTVPNTWTSGNYIIKLRRLGGSTQYESYMTFVVRDDSSSAAVVYGLDTTTWQAYNFWGGSGNNREGISLYGRTDDVSGADLPGSRAYTVSYDRPYLVSGSLDGAGMFMVWDFPMVRWMESQGYDMTYVASTDLESSTNLLSGHRAFVNVGHDEYYSDNMRSTLLNGIAAGTNMGLFSANNFYFRHTWHPNSSGRPLRRIHTDKGALTGLATVQWRYSNPARPENEIGGVMLGGVANSRHFLVDNASHWIYEGAGLTTYTGNGTTNVRTSGTGQNALPGLIGYEFDVRAVNGFDTGSFAATEPAGLQQLGHSFVPAADNGVNSWSDATIYTAASGATVFSAGTMQWSYGLDNGTVNGLVNGYCDCDHNFASTATRRVTKNILDRFSR